MTLELSGKAAIVTGAGSGINLCFTKLLLEKGCSVLMADVTLLPEAESLLDQYPHDESSSSKPFALFHETDVTSWPQLTSLWKTATGTFKTVDIVVPGAGIFEPLWSNFWNPPRTETNPDTPSQDDADANPGHYRTIDTNLVAPIRLSQLAIGHWTTERQKGCLVLIGSIAGIVDTPLRPLYHVTKHGIHGFVSSLAPLRDTLGIRVSAVAPGPVATPIWEQLANTASKMGAQIDWVDVDEVARAMYELVVNEEMGDGTILEVLKSGSRVMPRFPGASEELLTSTIAGYVQATEPFLDDVRADGLRT